MLQMFLYIFFRLKCQRSFFSLHGRVFFAFFFRQVLKTFPLVLFCLFAIDSTNIEVIIPWKPFFLVDILYRTFDKLKALRERERTHWNVNFSGFQYFFFTSSFWFMTHIFDCLDLVTISLFPGKKFQVPPCWHLKHWKKRVGVKTFVKL